MGQEMIEVQLESLLERSRARLFQDFVFEGVKLPSRRLRTSNRLSNGLLVGGLLMGFALMGAVTGMLHRSGSATLASNLGLRGIFALIAAQGLIAIGLTLKSMSDAAQNERMIQGLLQGQSHGAAAHSVRSARPTSHPPTRLIALPVPVPLESGRIGNRKFVRHSDNTVDVETLLGRRRFISLDAAQEFVGGTVVFETTPDNDPTTSAVLDVSR